MGYLSFRAPLADYDRAAASLLSDLQDGDVDAAWRVKWLHPRFRGQGVEAVQRATLDLADARQVVAREYAFETWADLAAYTEAVAAGGPVATFEMAVEAVVAGELASLGAMLRADPALARARSTRRHHATLLHYVAANGVEDARQRTPANAVEIARLLLDAGAEPDALADMYDAKCTTMSMLVSSAHPAGAGVQAALAEVLLDRGAALDGPGTNWQSAVLTALTFGFADTANVLVRRGAPVRDLPTASGLGRADDTARLLPGSDATARQAALALAAAHGHQEVVALLLDAGADPNSYNPDGYHSHATPLHLAVLTDQVDLVRLFVERGARLDVRDTLYHGTPLDWAVHEESPEVASYLRAATD